MEADKPDQTKVVAPSLEEQTVTPDDGYELAEVTIEAVTNEIDSNIQPENIKKDVSILGVTGTLEGGAGGSSKLPQLMAGTITELTAEDMQGVTHLKYHSIYNQSNLTSITIPETLTTYESTAIYQCRNVVEINYNATSATTTASAGMFHTLGTTSSGITLNIADNVISIPNYFTYISTYNDSSAVNITTINIGKGIQTFGAYAFTQLKNLTNVNYNATNCADISSYNSAPFGANVGATSGGFVVTIGEDVERIPANLFYKSDYLTKVKVLSDRLTAIGNSAFGGNAGKGASLFDFRNCTQVPTLPTSYSIRNASGCQIVIPDALYYEWSTATNWSALPTDPATNGYVVWVKASEYVEE